MNAREERGLVIAALCKLGKRGSEWNVPSQTNAEGVYRVCIEKQSCTCPDGFAQKRRNGRDFLTIACDWSESY